MIAVEEADYANPVAMSRSSAAVAGASLRSPGSTEGAIQGNAGDKKWRQRVTGRSREAGFSDTLAGTSVSSAHVAKRSTPHHT